jgi:transcriptional regulator with GAF, ATPase, and Fis domain
MESSIQAWLHPAEEQATLARTAVRDALAAVQLDASVCDLQEPSGPGILLFAGVTPSVCDLLRRVSHGGVERVLAVSLSAVPLGGVWSLLQAGASDVLTWANSLECAATIKARFERWHAVDDLLRLPMVREELIGHSAAWLTTLRQIVEVAHFTSASILIMGETGTGKELVARLIHALDNRPGKRDLVILDCTTIVPELSGSEFFGHERGAYTGAVSARDGAFALANGGTLFLDEAGELPLTLQSQLLRVIQEGAYKRVGSNTWHKTAFRLICATNRDLLQEVAQQRFRRDLYYRLASWVCTLPPLRERTADILPLAHHFMLEHLRAHQQPQAEPPELDDTVRDYLLLREYPGNVRDLRQIVWRIMDRYTGVGPITIGQLPEEDRPSGETADVWQGAELEQLARHALNAGASLKDIRATIEEAAIRLAIDAEQGNLQRAARKLGVTDRALQLRRAAQRNGERSG